MFGCAYRKENHNINTQQALQLLIKWFIKNNFSVKNVVELIIAAYAESNGIGILACNV